MRLRTFGGLWIVDVAAANGGPRPRPLALLAILAVAGAKGASRDQVIGILWPDSTSDRARHALSQTIYSMRRDVGADVVLATPNLRLDGELISSDVADFQNAVRDKNWGEAARLYVGPFLGGFYLADAPEFERWMEAERASLAADGLRAIETAAKGAAADGRQAEAADLWFRLAQLDPVNARFTISYMEALVAQGDRTTALSHGKAYAALLKREFDAEPDAAVQRLMSTLRDAERATTDPVRAFEAAVEDTMPGSRVAEPSGFLAAAHPLPVTPVLHESARGTHPFWKTAVIGASLLGIGMLVALGWRTAASSHETRPVLAVGRIRDVVVPASDTGTSGWAFSEMFATSLGRLNGLQVIAGSRMLELMPRGADTSRVATTDAARRAGATEMIEGEFIPLSDRRLRLDIRRVDVGRGIVRSGYQISGTDRIALLDSATVLIAADLRVVAPVGSLAAVSTRSPTAYRLYEEGLHAFYQSDVHNADRLFRAAMREDPAFAMAAYYAWRSADATGDTSRTTLSERALQLASHASDRDQLLIRTDVGRVRNEPSAIVAAESLAARYPRDPEALVRAAQALPDLARATSLADRSISLDSAAGVLPAAICRMCDALKQLVDRYEWADSSAAAERTLRRWIALRPDDSRPWANLADILLSVGRRDEAQAAMHKAEALGVLRGDAFTLSFAWNARSDDFAAAAAQCDAGLTIADIAQFSTARWYCTIALRMQGRYREAAALNNEGRIPRTNRSRRDPPKDRFQMAILAMEMGQPLTAAGEFLVLATAAGKSSVGPDARRARDVAWYLTLASTAAVAGGDTARARALVDSIEATGRRSWYGRDPLLHHFVRGILLSRAHQDTAAARELRLSIFSPTNGYTRANYELGRTMLALHRPNEGIPIVRSALRGGIEGSGLYVTRTELHELLAQLFDAASQRDSAAAHYAVVERAWRSADPFLKPRYEVARQRLAR